MKSGLMAILHQQIIYPLVFFNMGMYDSNLLQEGLVYIFMFS